MDLRSMRMAEDGKLSPFPKDPASRPRNHPRYVLERTNSFIKIWFWGRDSCCTPEEVANGAGSINTDKWVRPDVVQLGIVDSRLYEKGTPDAYFPNAQCDIGAHFGPARLIINIGLCE